MDDSHRKLAGSAEIRNDLRVIGFVSAAEAFRTAVTAAPVDREAWLESLHQSVARLYAAGTVLPEVDIETAEDVPEKYDVDDEEWKNTFFQIADALAHCRWYWLVFDPTSPMESTPEVVCGDLGDDIADIYRDVIPGLRAWHSGNEACVASIVFDWNQPLLGSHWGIHAVSALRAMHFLTYMRGLD